MITLHGTARLSALEQSHRKLAMGAQRALKMALSVHEKQAAWAGLAKVTCFRSVAGGLGDGGGV